MPSWIEWRCSHQSNALVLHCLHILNSINVVNKWYTPVHCNISTSSGSSFIWNLSKITCVESTWLCINSHTCPQALNSLLRPKLKLWTKIQPLTSFYSTWIQSLACISNAIKYFQSQCNHTQAPSNLWLKFIPENHIKNQIWTSHMPKSYKLTQDLGKNMCQANPMN
jgi:hypothetical protein